MIQNLEWVIRGLISFTAAAPSLNYELSALDPCSYRYSDVISAYICQVEITTMTITVMQPIPCSSRVYVKERGRLAGWNLKHGNIEYQGKCEPRGHKMSSIMSRIACTWEERNVGHLFFRRKKLISPKRWFGCIGGQLQKFIQSSHLMNIFPFLLLLF